MGVNGFGLNLLIVKEEPLFVTCFPMLPATWSHLVERHLPSGLIWIYVFLILDYPYHICHHLF
ncbi:hypothetical protein ABOONEI_223 [Aciduliprofundum boonei T469]|nr:hypothetical protein ABOONEI_223 [Aciduliprofundum boonei T469]